MYKAVGKARRKWFLTRGKYDKRDILVPWKKHAESDTTYHRYYHLFTLEELRQLSRES